MNLIIVYNYGELGSDCLRIEYITKQETITFKTDKEMLEYLDNLNLTPIRYYVAEKDFLTTPDIYRVIRRRN